MFKKSYSIPRIHTLCYLLKKMYYKYGFRYFDDENNQNVVNNKIILSNMKTYNLRFDLFIGLVFDKIKLEYLEDIESGLDFVYDKIKAKSPYMDKERMVDFDPSGFCCKN